MVSLAAACDVGGPDASPAGPALNVVAIDVSVEDPATPPPAGVPRSRTRVPVAFDGSTKPLPTTAIHVRVDRFLDPGTANRQAICLQSSTAVVRTLEECTAGLLLKPTYDPIRRTVSYYLDGAALAPSTFYRVTLLPADEETGDFGLRAFDGAAMSGIFALEFTTDAAAEGEAVEAPPVGPLYCGTPECLAACEGEPSCRIKCSLRETALLDCSSGGCHAVVKGQGRAAMGLDLSDPGGIAQTAIAHVAHQTQRGPGAAQADVSSIAFGRAMPIIQPGDPGRSYMLYKIAASAGFDPTGDLAEGEKTRLRDALVVGMPMPPATYDVPPIEQLDHLVKWIAGGADIADCTPAPTAPATDGAP